MRRILTVALIVAATSGTLMGATFLVRPHYSWPIGELPFESYVFSTTSPALISEIRSRIASGRSATPLIRIATGSDGINRNHFSSGAPLWKWHVVDVSDLDIFYEPAVIPNPGRDTPLSVIDADVQGFIDHHGDWISPRYLTRIVEIDPNDPGHLFNVSSRGVLGTGERVLITGFIVQGTTPRLVLVRALGPKLADYNVSDAAQDPSLTLFSGQERVARNDDWEESAGRFLIPPTLEPLDPKDAAIVVILDPGAYTVHAASPDEGIGVVDVFDLTAMK